MRCRLGILGFEIMRYFSILRLSARLKEVIAKLQTRSRSKPLRRLRFVRSNRAHEWNHVNPGQRNLQMSQDRKRQASVFPIARKFARVTYQASTTRRNEYGTKEPANEHQ